MTTIDGHVTDRLVLRRWRDSDRSAFHALNSDPEVMATIGPEMSRAESDAFMNRIEHRFALDGFGLWCVECMGAVIGFTGFMTPWFRDGVEIGWRIRSEHWGHGYATEAAQACLAHGFAHRSDGGLGFDEVISFTASSNHRSRRVMEKLGMHRDPDDDFDHPGVPPTSPLRPHVLYRISSSEGADS